MVPVRLGWEYFPQNKGFSSGVIYCGFGFGSLVFSLIATYLSNPDDDYPNIKAEGGYIFAPDSQVALRTPYMLRTLSWIQIPLYILAMILVQKKPQQSDSKTTALNSSFQSSPQFITTRQALWKLKTWLIWLMIVNSSCYGLFIASTFKSYGSIFIQSDNFLTLVGSIGAVTNGLGRPVLSTLQDKLGFRIVYGVMMVF